MKIAAQTVSSMVVGLVFLCASLFLPAGTLHYWQGWAFIAVFLVSTAIPSTYLAVKHPAALARRLKAGPAAETRPVQRVLITATILAVIAVLVVSALDHRFGWSSVPVPAVILGDVLVAVGLAVSQAVIVQNGYAAANVSVEAGQSLASTGLYARVRHPMYVGALVMMIGTPPALGSYWGMLAVLLAVPALAGRILDEEKMLVEQLAGYDDYAQRVRYRLVPGVW